MDVRPRVWFNADLESKNYIIPGLIAVIMMVIAALLTSLTVAREWERGTMEQLISTPVKGPELILGKLLPYFAIGMFDVAAGRADGRVSSSTCRCAATWRCCSAWRRSSWPARCRWACSSASSPRASCSPASWRWWLTFLPAFLLSGFMFTIANMPRAIQVITYLVPARYFVAMLKGIYLKGVGLEILAGQVVLLVVFAVVMVLLAQVKFRRS